MKCEDCKKRKATIKFSNEPMLALTHGWGTIDICKPCYIIRIENHVKECKQQLKELKK